MNRLTELKRLRDLYYYLSDNRNFADIAGSLEKNHYVSGFTEICSTMKTPDISKYFLDFIYEFRRSINIVLEK